MKIAIGRFPSGGTVLDWMVAAGFARVEWCLAEHIVHQHVGRAVLADPILQKHGTSQLALLTDEAYAAGLRPGDVIVTFNGTTLEDQSHFVRLLADAKIGSTVTLGVVREGKSMSVKVPIVKSTGQARRR